MPLSAMQSEHVILAGIWTQIADGRAFLVPMTATPLHLFCLSKGFTNLRRMLRYTKKENSYQIWSWNSKDVKHKKNH